MLIYMRSEGRMDPKQMNWEELIKLYDATHAKRASRRSGSSGGSGKRGDLKKEWDPKVLQYMKVQIDGRWISEALYGVSRCSLNLSDDHIAHVVLRMYVRKVVPFPRPFGLEGELPDEVWEYMVRRAHEMHEQAREDIDWESEAWNRPDLTYWKVVEYWRPKGYHGRK
jgi:hypothetical protein